MTRDFGNVSVRILKLARLALVIGLLLLTVACSEDVVPSSACTEEGRTLKFGYYAHFAPVSHSGDEDPASEGYNTHVGYEADLLTALEGMKGANLSPSRSGTASGSNQPDRSTTSLEAALRSSTRELATRRAKGSSSSPQDTSRSASPSWCVQRTLTDSPVMPR